MGLRESGQPLAALALTALLAACADPPQPPPDGPRRDAGIDARIPDVRAPDTRTWSPCPTGTGERLCQPHPAGAPCCPDPSSQRCAPGSLCRVIRCPDAGLFVDSGPGCPPGRFCRSAGGCACVPALGEPCRCGGSCVASCSGTTQRCPW